MLDGQAHIDPGSDPAPAPPPMAEEGVAAEERAALTWSAAADDREPPGGGGGGGRGGEGFERWREVVCQTYTRLSPERLGDTPFAGEIRMRPIAGGASVSRITSTGQLVHRRAADVAARPCEALFVNLQVEGRSTVRQRDTETRLEPGCFTLLDARRPFAMRFEGPFRQVCLHLPLALFEESRFDGAGLLARRIAGDSVFGIALREQLHGLLDGQDAPDIRHLAYLLRLACEGGRRPLLADEHLAMLQKHVAAHAGDAALCPRAVADHFRISIRHLHKLFAHSGESFGRYLLRRRLEHSLQAILAAPDRPITEIALESGFSDSSHFARAFRQRYNQSPRAVRRAAAMRRG